ncbi:unnamed protein product [Polarella glacialis]|uniref:Uncharacterized protein n=1 Tax=Polarella glacialis TaxID=89957 RepID=A0A813G4Z4_POLGL|nr:unnamed protein product [Polarella glacialis]
MSPEEQQMLMQHVIGFVGVCTNVGLSVSPLITIREARSIGSLGGMDTNAWPRFFGNNLIWSCYSFLLGDVWLFLACAPSAMLWLFFCLSAVRLLAQEEGETLVNSGGGWGGGWGGGAWDGFTIDLQKLSKRYRQACIHRLEKGVMTWFCCSPWNIRGLEQWETIFDREKRLFVMMVLCGLASMRLFTGPVARLWGIMKLRDASTVFVPLTLSVLVSCSVWVGYGFAINNVASWAPNAVGVIVSLLQLLLRCVFGAPAAAAAKASEKESEIASAKVGKEAGASDVASSSMTWDAGESDVASTMAESEVPSEFTNNSSTNSMKIVEASSLAAKKKGPAKASPLPDLTDRLKEQGIYEDYLNWQRDYRRWRQGGLKGASGEVTDKVGVTYRENALLPIDENLNNDNHNKDLEGQLTEASDWVGV